MKSIPKLLAAVPTGKLAITETGDQMRLRGPVLALESDSVPLAYASGFGGVKRRQEAENALMLFKALMERAEEVFDDGSVPIRLTPIPTTCRMLPLSRI